MRAKTINEDQNFERGRTAKAALGVGGINLHNLYRKKIEKLESEISLAKNSADTEWEDYLRETLVGKKITAKMTKMVTFNIKTKVRSEGGQKYGEFTIEVQDIRPGEDLSEVIGRNLEMTPQVIIADMNNSLYTMKLDQKIYIE